MLIICSSSQTLLSCHNNNSDVNILSGQVSSDNPKLGWIIDWSVNFFIFPLTLNWGVEVSLSSSGNCPQKPCLSLVALSQPFLVHQKDKSIWPAPHLLGFIYAHSSPFSVICYTRGWKAGWKLPVPPQHKIPPRSDNVVSQPCDVFQSDHTIAGLERLSAATSISSCSLDQLLGVFCEGFLVIMDMWGKQLLGITVWEQGASSSKELQFKTMNSWWTKAHLGVLLKQLIGKWCPKGQIHRWVRHSLSAKIAFQNGHQMASTSLILVCDLRVWSVTLEYFSLFIFSL